jgi:cytidine deaminase
VATSAKPTVRKARARKVTAVEINARNGAGQSNITFEADGEGIELVFGLVAPTGVDLGKVYESLKAQLKTVNYEVVVVRLSSLITQYLLGKEPSFSSEYDRIKTLMDHGTTLRERTSQRDIVARLGVASIRAIRNTVTGSDYKPRGRVAYIVSSFKRPEEVELFREIYGKAFTLISVYSPRPQRVDDLAKRLRPSVPKGKKPGELAVQLIERDYEEEGRKLGQRMGKTFPLADYFVTVESKSGLDAHLLRLVQLTFGHPYISPARDEQGMFFAQAAALRALDLSRQVGAAIVDGDGSLITTGCNEVPKYGGGLYWGEDADVTRDYELGHDANVLIKAEILEDTIDHMKREGWLSPRFKKLTNKQMADEALFGATPFLKSSLMYDVIEFGRAVHAEGAAIAEAARRGVSIKGGRLFCTTFPCHICARHIVASGIDEVIFVEPYEKSRTGELYSDSVSVEPQEPSTKRANFKAFVGVAPRRYMDFFQASTSRKKDNGKIFEMDEIAEKPRIKRIVLTYLLVEDMVIRDTKPVPKLRRKGDAK